MTRREELAHGGLVGDGGILPVAQQLLLLAVIPRDSLGLGRLARLNRGQRQVQRLELAVDVPARAAKYGTDKTLSFQ
jgi:hypothetical protein